MYERPHTLTLVYTQRVYDVYTDVEGYDRRDGTYFKVWRVSWRCERCRVVCAVCVVGREVSPTGQSRRTSVARPKKRKWSVRLSRIAASERVVVRLAARAQ